MTYNWLNLARGEARSWMTSFGCVTLFKCPYILQTPVQTLSQFPHYSTSVQRVHLVESSPALRAVQEKKLQAWGGKSLELHWHDSIEDVPTTDGVYTMLVAHEFFDALPFHLIEVRRRHLYRCQTDTLDLHRKVIKVGKRS
jgi:SAM-dependent MidA family methyltransferase